MANEESALAVDLRANVKQFERAMQTAANQTEANLRKIEKRFETANKKLDRDALKTRAAFTSAAGGIDVMTGSIGRWAAALAGAFSAREVMQMADAFTTLQNRLKVAGLSGQELAAVQDHLFASASRNGVEISALGELYGRLALSTGELGVTQGDLLRFVDGVTASLRVQGTSTQAASGALLQLAQALGAGTVRAEEINSIMEATPIIAQAAAKGMGTSVGEMRKAVNDGTVSSQAFFAALMRGFPEIEKQAESATMTISQSLTGLRNELLKYVGQTDEALDASDRMSKAIQALAGNIDHIIPIVAGLTVGWGVGYVASVIAAGAATRNLDKALNLIRAHPVVATLTVLTAGLTAVALEARNVDQAMGDLRGSIDQARDFIDQAREASGAASTAVNSLGAEAGVATGKMDQFTDANGRAAASLYELARAKRAAALADVQTRREEVSRNTSTLQLGSRDTRRRNFADELNFSGRNASTIGESWQRGMRFFAGEWRSLISGGASDAELEESIRSGLGSLRELDAEARRIASLPDEHWAEEVRRLRAGAGGGGAGGGRKGGAGRTTVDRTPQLRAEIDLEERLAAVRATGDDAAIKAEEERQRLSQLAARYREAGYADAEQRAMQMVAWENQALIVVEERAKEEERIAKARDQVLDAMRRENALAEDALEFRREVARLAGDEATLREIAIAQRAKELRAMQPTLSDAAAQGQAADEQRLLDAAAAYGEAREEFSRAFSDGIRALVEGDFANFAASLADQFAERALDRLGEQVFDTIFGGFNAAAEGTAAGAAQASVVAPAILTAGAGAATAMGTAITAAGAAAAAQMAAAVAGANLGKFALPFASGGQVRGPGTGTSDSILARLSNGEFVTNAKATKRFRPLLEAINSGAGLPGFASGGVVLAPTNEIGSEMLAPDQTTILSARRAAR